MKKYFCALLILLICGCGKKDEIICSINSTYEDINYSIEVILKNKENTITSYDVIMHFDNAADAQKMCNVYKKFNEVIKEDEKLNFECKENTLEFADSALFGETENKLDEFRETLEKEGYTCKS